MHELFTENVYVLIFSLIGNIAPLFLIPFLYFQLYKVENKKRLSTFEMLQEYCQVTGRGDKYGVVHKDSCGNYFVQTFEKNKITDLGYQGEERIYSHLLGEIVSISYGTCGGTCEIGKPSDKCIKEKNYSKDKCAVVMLDKLNTQCSILNLTYEELFVLLSER